MLSKLVEELLGDASLRDEFAVDPRAVMQRYALRQGEMEMLSSGELESFADRVDPDLLASLLDLASVAMTDLSHPGPNALRITDFSPTVLRAGQPAELRVGVAWDPMESGPERLPAEAELEIHTPSAAGRTAFAAEIIERNAAGFVVVATGVLVAQPGRFPVSLVLEEAGPGTVTSRRCLRVEANG